MIQRIQTIFLLLAGGAFGTLAGVPIVTGPRTVDGVLSDGGLSIFDALPLQVITWVGVAVIVLSILMFKRRQSQIRLNYVAILIGLAICVMAYLLLSHSIPSLAGVQPAVGAFLPLLAIVLILVANRYIRKDENLVKSMDRLR